VVVTIYRNILGLLVFMKQRKEFYLHPCWTLCNFILVS